MKKHIILLAMLLATGFSHVAKAQVGLSVNINLQPLWGPTGYDHVSYYYLPDIDAYYDVPNQVYVYMNGGHWVKRKTLPPQYASYDMYGGYKAVINEPSPWLHNDKYRAQYASYKGRHDQPMIRDSHEDKYRANPHHPEHSQWHGAPPHQVKPHPNHGPRGNAGHDDHGHDDHGHDGQGR